MDEKKILLKVAGETVEMPFMEGTDLVTTLRNRVTEKEPSKDPFVVVPVGTDTMTYEHVLYLSELPVNGFTIQVEEGPQVGLDDFVTFDMGDKDELTLVLTPKVYRDDAIHFVDFDSTGGGISIPYAEGSALRELLDSCKAPVSERTILKGMTWQDVRNILEYKYKQDVSNSMLKIMGGSDATLDLNALVPKKDALSEEGITVMAAAAIEGN